MDYKFSIIVPCFRGKFEEVKRNFDSVLDQDYKNWEIIFVPNGQWKGKKALIERIKREYKMVKILDVEEANVCTARNKGAEIATGDIFSFLSSDLALHPGTLRTWQLEFTKHPECAFVYSGYRFFPNVETDIFLSEEFDEYKLGCYNYIDGANPVRREANEPFDPEIRSLNDWDWILSVVVKGHKGHYIPEPLYSAEYPKAGGLSWDSSSHWLERTEKIKRKHKIPTREVCCTSLIDSEEALRIAKIINADFHPYPADKPNRYKVIYCYGFATSNELLQAQAAALGAEVFGAEKIIHWVGIDITLLTKRSWGEVEALTKGIFAKIKNHWVIGKADEQILNEMFRGSGIKLKKIFPPLDIIRNEELNDFVYVSDLALMEQLKKAMPDIDFQNSNNDGIPKVSIHFQDRPANVIKALAEGSFVISEKLMPYIGRLNCTNIPEIRQQIVHTIRSLNRDGIKKDKKAMRYYRDKYYFRENISKILTKMPQRRLGKLEDLLDVMPPQSRLKS